MQDQELIPHLFRTEFSKMCSVLSGIFGIKNLESVEDLVSETFISALDTWPYKGVPENPTAWLYTVAKNKAKNYLHRNRIFSEKVLPEWQNERGLDTTINFSEQAVSDSMLQMLFAVCHPEISTEAQIGLALRILCGFGIHEIASAFLTNSATINKRLQRARNKLRESQWKLEFPPEREILKRLNSVLTTLYLLFNEGYYSENNEVIIREELCLEAMRLTELLLENPKTRLPKVHALYSIMCFQASRLQARKSSDGTFILYEQQDQAQWDSSLISAGAWHLKEAAQGNELSVYHLEACIAWWYTQQEDTSEKWEQILTLYNQLLALNYSPFAALNRTYAYARVYGPAAAIPEAEKLGMEHNHFYQVLLGELYQTINSEYAEIHYRKAKKLATTERERKLISERIQALKSKIAKA